VHGDWVYGRNWLFQPIHLQQIVLWERDGRIHQATRLARIVYEELFVPLALRVAIIAAFGDDVDLFPIMHADIICDQRFRFRVPLQAVWIAKTVRVDLAAGASDRYKGIRVRSAGRKPVSPIRADRVLRT